MFTVQVTAGGDYTFTLVDQLDHVSGTGENSLTIDLSSIVRSTDFSDGDTVSLSNDFKLLCRTTFRSCRRLRCRRPWRKTTNNAQSVGNNEDASVGKTVATGSLMMLVSVGP